jgi:hypothetical protein
MSYPLNNTTNQANVAFQLLSGTTLSFLGDETLLFGKEFTAPNSSTKSSPDRPIVLRKIEASAGSIMKGQRYTIRKERPVTATDRSENSPVNLQTRTYELIDLFVNRYKEVGVGTTRRAKAQTSTYDAQSNAAANASALARAMEQDIYAIFPTFSRSLGDGTTSRTSADIVNALNVFQNNGMDVRNYQIYDLCTPEVYSSYKLEDQIRRWDHIGQTGANNYIKGYIQETVNGAKPIPTSYGGSPDGLPINRAGSAPYQAVMVGNGADPIFLGMGLQYNATNETIPLMDGAEADYATILYGVTRGRDEAGVYMNYLNLNGRPASVLN